MPLLEELRQRNVFRVALAYLVVGWLLTEVLTTILPTLGAPEWMSRAVILIFAFGFIPAVVFSWFYELTPEGIKRESEVDRELPGSRRIRRRFDYVTIGAVVLLIVVIGLFGALQGGDDSAPAVAEISDASVAVLPFVNMSNDEDNEYFSDGLTETLLHMLAQIPDLKVAARTSSFSFKGRSTTIAEIATTLGVAHVLEGSVQRSGDRIRVTAQLIRASDGFHVWSEVYDRTLDDIFAIQDEIATEVGGALSASLLPDTPAGGTVAGLATADADAYDLYLQALNERAKFSYGGLQASEDLLKGALTIDPDFTEAKTALAYNYFEQVETGLMSGQDAFPEVQALVAQVLEAEPDDGAAAAAKIFADMMVTANEGAPESLPEIARELESLVAEQPEDLAIRILLVRVLQGMQKNQEAALQVLLEAEEQDPLNPRVHYELGSIYANLGRIAEARAALELSLELEPSQPNAYATLAALALHEGDGVGYVRNFLQAIEVDPKDHELPGIVAGFLYELGLVEEGDDFRNRVLAIAPTSEIAYRIELQRAINMGDEEASIAAARSAIEADIDDRRYAFGGAVQHLLRMAVKNGTIQETFDYLESQAPGILDINAENLPLKYRGVQYNTLEAWHETLSQEELEAQLNDLIEIARTYGFEPTEDPGTHVGILVLRGQIDEAVELALEHVFTEPVGMNLAWERDFAQPFGIEFAADPRIQAALARWGVEEAALRANVQRYLADLQAST